MVSYQNYVHGYSIFDITFDPDIYISESFYPNASSSDMLSNFGGALVLWLGMGILQILN